MILIEHEPGALRRDPGRAIAFLDRDGVILEHRPNYLRYAEDVRLLPGAAEAVRLLGQMGCLTVVVTNQACVGKGLVTMPLMLDLHQQAVDLLRAQGAQLHASVICPHAPAEGCGCRKPGAGMLHSVLSLVGSHPGPAVMVGDTIGDLRAAWTVGATAYLVRSGLGAVTSEFLSPDERARVHECDDLASAVKQVARQAGIDDSSIARSFAGEPPQDAVLRGRPRDRPSHVPGTFSC